MNRMVLGLAALLVPGLLATAWSGPAFAQTSSIATACPTSFQCGFTAAETYPFDTTGAGNAPGQPNASIGYLSFDASGDATISGVQNLDGTVTTISGTPGTCTAGSGGNPATIDFADGSQLSFVTDAQGAELQFILTKNVSSSPNGKGAIPVRVGTCRKM